MQKTPVQSLVRKLEPQISTKSSYTTTKNPAGCKEDWRSRVAHSKTPNSQINRYINKQIAKCKRSWGWDLLVKTLVSFLGVWVALFRCSPISSSLFYQGCRRAPLAQGFSPFSLKPGLCFLPTYHFTTHSYSKHLWLLFSVVSPTAMTLYRSVLVWSLFPGRSWGRLPCSKGKTTSCLSFPTQEVP